MIACPICRREFRSLMSHMRAKHELDTAAFAERFPGYSMVSAETRALVGASTKGKGRPVGTLMSEEQRAMYSRLFSGSRNPFAGRKHDAEARLRMSLNHADVNGDANPYRKAITADPSLRQVASDRWRAFWSQFKASARYGVYRRLRGEINADRPAFAFGRGHACGRYFSERQGIRIVYRSSYELLFLRQCEATATIQSFGSCSFRIPYTAADGMARLYLPDFLIDGIEIVEVKPASLLQFGSNPLKFAAGARFAASNNMTFRVVTEAELGIGRRVA